MAKDSSVQDKDKPVKINKWDSSAVKNALDDAVKEVLTKKFNYVENFKLMDGRLVMCGIAVGVAMFALLWDYLYPFPQSRYDDKYNLVLSCKDGKTGTLREASLVKSVANFFDDSGMLIYEVLEPEISKLHNSLLSDRKEK
ncbi:probable signal peptidase complex subunit 2 isoform X2 [Cryptotermes secundus]|uniref:probable signal peptidase complex subunit 2 isoform X2 n=1 Tax=Cryptotermes secundus TaxID=105785 RepID=UPI001454DAE1|nr:probable signal peptidase complex subunit 2 isoform X2 [Cryptotermes secundus]